MRVMPCASQFAIARVQIRQRDLIDRKPAHQRAPLGGHVGDAQARVHAERCHARAGELDCGVQHLFVVVQSAERDDDVLAGHARRQLALEHNLNGARNLPPELARCPDGGCVGAHHRRADRAQRAVHVGVRIGGDDERSRQHVTFLHHDLVADAGARRIEVDAVLARERLHAAVLRQVRLFRVLNVVIGSEHRLRRVVDTRRRRWP